MKHSQFKYLATDVAKILAAASGRPYSTSMLCYYATAGLAVPESRNKYGASYYRYDQVVMLYICRYLRAYGLPTSKVQGLIETSSYRNMLKAILRDGDYHLVGNEDMLKVITQKEELPFGQFFWCLPLIGFKEDIDFTIDQLVEAAEIEPVKR